MPKLIIALGLCLIACAPAFADSPPPPPADWDLFSDNGRYVAHGDLKANKITVKEANSSKKTLWEMSPWQQRSGLQLSDNGQSMAQFYATGIQRDLRQKVLTIINRGSPVRTWLLTDFFDHAGKLNRTVSHFVWTSDSRWIGNTFEVTTVDGRRLMFDGTTGQLQK